MPRGVIAVVCPWNLPLLLMTWKVGPALACGNTVVVKPSEETPSTATLLGEVMNKVGVPKGVYNVVHGFGPGSAGAFLTSHPDVNGITFTGETSTGTAIMKAGAEGIRPVSLELGGKNAALVFADCDFEVAVDTVTRSAFENCGQVCLGTERVYVERPIFDKFVKALEAKAEGMKPGRPDDPATKIGPLVSQEHRQKVLSYYKKAKDEGATIVTGGGVPEMPADAEGRGVGPADHLDRAAGDRVGRARGDIRPVLPHPAVRYRGRGAAHGQRHEIRAGDLDLHQRHRPRQPARRQDRGGPVLDQQLVPARSAHAVRRLQASGIGREGGVHSLEFYTELRNVMIKY